MYNPLLKYCFAVNVNKGKKDTGANGNLQLAVRTLHHCH